MYEIGSDADLSTHSCSMCSGSPKKLPKLALKVADSLFIRIAYISLISFNELPPCSLNQGGGLIILEDWEQPSSTHWTHCISWASRRNSIKLESMCDSPLMFCYRWYERVISCCRKKSVLGATLACICDSYLVHLLLLVPGSMPCL